MDVGALKASLGRDTAPTGLARPILALWHCGRGEWDAAHALVQQDEGDPDHDWVHAHLHRVEGDASNAGHWYRRAGRPVARCALEVEWAEIAAALLPRPR